MKNKTRLVVWIIVALLILLIPLAMLFSNEVQWNETIAYSVLLLVIGGIYELWQWLKKCTRTYRFAFGVGLAGLILLGWVSGAVGIIGSENNSVNLLYWTILTVIIIGALISRLKSHGMSGTLFVTAAVQFLIPFFALFIWPAKTSWGGAGVIGVIIINTFFALIFLASALLFRRARDYQSVKSG